MGLSIRAGGNVQIYSPYISNCWGDGIFFSNLCKNITVYNPVLDNNRRNGVSIVYADSIKIYNMLSANTNGTAPMAGIDIEPDHNFEITDHILLDSPITFNNSARGILIAMKNIFGPQSKNLNIDINNPRDIGSDCGIAFYLGNRKPGLSPLNGNIHITNPDWGGARRTPIYMDPEMDVNQVNVQITNPKIRGVVTRDMNKVLNRTKNVQIN